MRKSTSTVRKEREFQKRMSHSVTDPNHDEVSIRENLILTALNAMMDDVDQTLTVPKALEQNKLIWAKGMLQQKPLQEIISNFTDQVHRHVRRELSKNREDVEKEMKRRRPPDPS